MVTKKTILLVGASHRSLGVEQNILDRESFKVLTALSGQEAFHIHRREKANLLIIDFEVANPKAEELCSLVRSNVDLRHASILIIGGNTSADKDRFLACNANEYLEKPFTYQVFHQKIGKLLKISPRKSYRGDVHVKVTSRLRSETFLAISRNLSKSGMLLVADKHLVKGEILDCSFALPNIAMIITQGEVVRVGLKETDGQGYGVKFTKISLQDIVHLEHFVHSHVKK
jgi:response regulator RpfG family c-di-GMP phosphodiesterase